MIISYLLHSKPGSPVSIGREQTQIVAFVRPNRKCYKMQCNIHELHSYQFIFQLSKARKGWESA